MDEGRPHGLVLLAVLVIGCRARVDVADPADWYAGAGFSAMPQVGVAAEAGRVLSRTRMADVAAEAEAAYQFLDDKDFADDGNVGAEDVTQARAGVLFRMSPGHKRHITMRLGAVWLRARGEPLILDRPGEYFGGYAGFGFETDLTERWTAGPEGRLLLLEGEGDLGFEIVPQFAWHFVYRW